MKPGDGVWRRFRAHVRGLWPRYAFAPALVFVGWPAYCFSIGERRWELGVLALIGGVMPYVGPKSKRVFMGLMPLGLVGVFYDAMRFVKNAGITPARIHVCDLRAVEMRFFGVDVGGHMGTVQDWVQAHPSLSLDVFFAIPYGTFLGAAAFFALFLYFVDYDGMLRFSSAFLALNVLGFITYHVYPAAPPWYFHAHGCAADLAARASEGPNLARVDAWLGVKYFGGFYGRSNDVFGAVPSLHVAYPLLMVIEGYRPFGSLRRARWLAWPLRAAAVAFFLWMCAAAVYLDHHWIVDVVLGCLYAVVVFSVFRTIRFFAPGRASEVPEEPNDGRRRQYHGARSGPRRLGARVREGVLHRRGHRAAGAVAPGSRARRIRRPFERPQRRQHHVESDRHHLDPRR